MPTDAARAGDAARVLVAPGTFATPLVALLLDAFGTDALGWDARTVALEVEEAFGVAPPAPNYARLMAGVVLVTTDRFYKSLPDFCRLAAVLSGGILDPCTVELPAAAEIAWGITEALLLGPPEPGDDEPFAGDIVAYIGRAVAREGILEPPDVLAVGLRGGRRGLSHALAQHAGAPALSAAIREVEARRTDAINRTIKSGLHTLIDQLSSLDLANGDARALRGRIQHRSLAKGP